MVMPAKMRMSAARLGARSPRGARPIKSLVRRLVVQEDWGQCQLAEARPAGPLLQLHPLNQQAAQRRQAEVRQMVELRAAVVVMGSKKSRTGYAWQKWLPCLNPI